MIDDVLNTTDTDTLAAKRLGHLIATILPPGWSRAGFHVDLPGDRECRCGSRVVGGGFVAIGHESDLVCALVLVSHMWERSGQPYSDYVAERLVALSIRLGKAHDLESFREHLKAAASTLLLGNRVRLYEEGDAALRPDAREDP